MLKMNEYQISKLVLKTLSIKFCFVKANKKYILVLLNEAEDGFNKAKNILLNNEECGTLAMDLAEFKEIEDFDLVNKFFTNNKSSVTR